MNATRSTIAVTAGLIAMLTTSCSSSSDYVYVEPATVQAVDGELSQVQLTEAAAARTGIETTPVLQETVDGVERLVIPYSAVMYHFDGTTWTYTRPGDLTYVRAAIEIESIDGQRAILTAGPPEGTEVVTVGAAELYGVEFGVGK
jgi:hypothetical protein